MIQYSKGHFNQVSVPRATATNEDLDANQFILDFIEENSNHLEQQEDESQSLLAESQTLMAESQSLLAESQSLLADTNEIYEATPDLFTPRRSKRLTFYEL